MASMPRTPSDVLDPLSQKTRPLIPLPRTGSLPINADLAVLQKARQFIILPKRLSVSLPSRVPITNQGPSGSQDSRISGMKIDFPLSFFGTCARRVMAKLRWRATATTPLPKDGDISEGRGPQRTDAISLNTQTARANRSMRNVMKIRQRGHHNRTVGEY